jgi:hypothetical protein
VPASSGQRYTARSRNARPAAGYLLPDMCGPGHYSLYPWPRFTPRCRRIGRCVSSSRSVLSTSHRKRSLNCLSCTTPPRGYPANPQAYTRLPSCSVQKMSQTNQRQPKENRHCHHSARIRPPHPPPTTACRPLQAHSSWRNPIFLPATTARTVASTAITPISGVSSIS